MKGGKGKIVSNWVIDEIQKAIGKWYTVNMQNQHPWAKKRNVEEHTHTETIPLQQGVQDLTHEELHFHHWLLQFLYKKGKKSKLNIKYYVEKQHEQVYA